MTEHQTIKIEGTYIVQDYRRTLFLQSYKKFAIAVILYFIVVTPMFWLTFFGAGANPFEEKNSSVVLLISLFAITPVLIAGAICWNIDHQAKKNGEILKPAKFIFSYDGVESKIESKLKSSQVKIDWKAVEKIQELKDYFLFYPQKNIFHPIPKRFFQNEHQITEFKNLVREKLGAKAKLQN